MIRCIMNVIILVSLSGCATFSQPGTVFFRTGQQKKLVRAVALLEQKEPSAATELLTEICADPPVPGITDEALFRLSLLHLRFGQERKATVRARQDLELLKKEFPGSSWTTLGTTLA